MGPPNEDQVRWAQRSAAFYRKCGYNPLPSRHDKKAPALSAFSYDELLDDARYAKWEAGNVQVCTGRRWNLGVVDCDGKEACLQFAAWWEAQVKGKTKEELESKLYRDTMPWIVKTGGGGLHFWFRLPEDLLWLPTRRLWGIWEPDRGERGGWKPRANIELLGDKALVVSPPSVHVATGKRYEWFDQYTPKYVDVPGIIPDWILGLPTHEAPRAPGAMDVGPPVERQSSPAGDEYDREDVLKAIPDKVAVAAGWRVRFPHTYANDAGWVPCHAISKATPGSRSDDVHPSARFHVDLGLYKEMYADNDRAMSLFDLGVACGAYSHWRDCLNDLGARYGAVRFRDSGR